MGLTWPWLLVVGVSLVVAAAVVGYLLPGKRLSSERTTRLAGTDRYTALPAVRAGIVRGRRTAWLVVSAALVVGLGGAIVAARPVDRVLEQREVSNRDVVLCLDVSGSMEETASDLANAYAEMVAGFNGDRVALSIFNARSVSVFPLTDDYDFLEQKLSEMADWLDSGTDWLDDFDIISWLGVIDIESEYSSLISDGLASCLDMFDHPEQTRSRSIVFATDNEYNGEPLITMDQAVAMAKQAGVKVYGIDPFSATLPTEARDLEAAVLATGGRYFEAYDTEAVGQVVRQITAEHPAPLQLPPRLMVTDHPGFGALLAGVGALLLTVVVAPWTYLRRRMRRGDSGV